MVKNDKQAKRMSAKLHDILNQIKQLESQYFGIELEIRVVGYRNEVEKCKKY